MSIAELPPLSARRAAGRLDALILSYHFYRQLHHASDIRSPTKTWLNYSGTSRFLADIALPRVTQAAGTIINAIDRRLGRMLGSIDAADDFLLRIIARAAPP